MITKNILFWDINHLHAKIYGVKGHSKKYKKFQALLVKARKDAGLTQVAVSKKLGTPQSFVSKYETGERRLDVVEFSYVAKALGLEPNDLFERLG